MKVYFIIAVCILILSVCPIAKDLGNQPNMTLDIPNQTLRVHRDGNISFSVTNYGLIGSQGRQQYDSLTGLPAPSAEFPKNSGIEYLFSGNIWIGAKVERPDQPGVFDTLVSVGNDGWWGNIFELQPLDSSHSSMRYDPITGDEEYFAEFYDTVTDSRYVFPDPNDGRQHIPIGLEITQNSIGWNSPGYDEYFIINYYIKNIYNRTLHDVWFGIYYDGDVFHISENTLSDPEAGAQDDICGYVQHGDYGIAWLADNNGQPNQNMQFDEFSSTGVMALMLLGHSGEAVQTNFNWWISNMTSLYDWGPMLQTNYARLSQIFGIPVFPGGGLGTPGGDRAKYLVMSNGEHDYDQIYSAFDFSSQGWVPNSTYDPLDLANGYDTRFLISYGPMEISAGEVETLTVAYIGGDNFHTAPLNYELHLRNYCDDSVQIRQYYENLNFSDLFTKADSIISFYERDYSRIPFGPPGNFHVANFDTNYVTLSWKLKNNPQLSEYRIYRGMQSGVYDSIPISPIGLLDTIFTDTPMANHDMYYYVIVSAKAGDVEGKRSNEIVISPGQPHEPTGLTAKGGNSQIELSWQPPPDNDINGYLIYKGFYFDTLSVIDTVTDTLYTVSDLINGIKYSFAVAAIDNHNLISTRSDTVAAFPMGFDSGILMVNQNAYTANPDYDSMWIFYDRALYDYQYYMTSVLPETLMDLAPYSIAILAKDWIGDGSLNISDANQKFADYLDAGGNLIVATFRLYESFGFSGTMIFSQNSFARKYLNLEGISFTEISGDSQFVGGISHTPLFDDFSMDSTRIRRITRAPWPSSPIYHGVGTLIPVDSTEVIYGYDSYYPDTSSLYNKPIAIVHQTPKYTTITTDIPFYYVAEPRSMQIIHTMIDIANENVGIDNTDVELPAKTELLQNYPNPFNSETSFKYTLAATDHVQLVIYNLMGQKVATLVNQNQPAGSYICNWRATQLSSGLYFARLDIGDKKDMIKMLLLK
jgi:hypothetical protein